MLTESSTPVPSTSPLPTLYLSFRRAEMTAFWMLTTALVSAGLGVSAAALGARAPWAWAAGGLSVLLPGLVWHQWFEIGIRAWNKMARVSAAGLRAYTLKVCYYLLFSAVSHSGSSLALTLGEAETSRWVRRADPAFDDGSPQAIRGGWAEGLLAAARQPGKAWTICLVPIVLLLLVLRDDQQDSTPSSSTYTLY